METALPTALYDGRDYDGEYGDGDIIGIVGTCGKRKSGKTFRVWLSVELCFRRLVVFDSENQYRAPKYNINGYAVISTPGELKQFLASNLDADQVRIIYKPLQGKKLWHFRTVTEILLKWGKRLHERGKGLIYFVDEMDQFCPPHEKLEIFCPELNIAVEYGRHQGLSLAWDARRIYTIHPKVRAQTSQYRVFKNTEPLDQKYFEKIIGTEAANELPKLKKYQYVWWTDDADVEWQVRGGPVKKSGVAIHDRKQSA